MTKQEMIDFIVDNPIYEGTKDKKWLMGKSKEKIADILNELELAEDSYWENHYGITSVFY